MKSKMQYWRIAQLEVCPNEKQDAILTQARVPGAARDFSARVNFRCWLSSPFLIGRMFLREPSWKYSSKLYSGSKKLRSTCSGNIRPIRRSLPLIGWEQSFPVDEEKTKIKMDDGVARFLTRFGGNLFICWLVGGAALSRRHRMR